HLGVRWCDTTALQNEVNVAVAPWAILECGGATPLWIFCRQSRTPEPTAVNFSANTREPNNPKRCPTTALQNEVNVAVAPCTFLECGGATPLWIFCRQSRTPEPTAVNFSANTREPNNPKRCPTTALQNGVSGLAIELLHQFGDQSRIVLCNEVID